MKTNFSLEGIFTLLIFSTKKKPGIDPGSKFSSAF